MQYIRSIFSACLLSLAACGISSAAHAEELQPKIESFVLKNGMEVIVLPNHRVPAVSHMLWFRVGAGDDPVGKSGLAHYHEHIMFRGTHKQKPGDYARIIMQHGGNQNAFTSSDMTSYYANIAKEHLPVLMAMERDRIADLSPDAKDALRERDVIIEERRNRIENKPMALMFEQLNAALFLNHPYHRPVIGWMHEMEGLTRDDVLAFHRLYYQPRNCVLVVAGDITAAELKPLAEKYYGDLPGGVKAARNWLKEPPQRAERSLVMRSSEVTQPRWIRQYLAPSVIYGDTSKALPLFIMVKILGDGETSRLNQSLVMTQKLATDVSADYSGFTFGPSKVTLAAVPMDGVSFPQLEKAIEAEVQNIEDKGVTLEELVRAKTQLKAETLYAQDGLQSMAYIVGELRVLGLPIDYIQHWSEKVDAVTAEQVQEAAKMVFQKESSVTGLLLPPEEKKEEKGKTDAK